MPPRTGHLDTAEHMLGSRRRIKCIETSTASPSKKNLPGTSILNKEIPRVKLKENIIVKSEFFLQTGDCESQMEHGGHYLGEGDVMV